MEETKIANLNNDKKKFYLTKQGLEKMKKEYQQLLGIRNAKTKGDVPSIFHSEELSPEYLDFFEDLDLLEAKLADMEYILKNYELIKVPQKKEQDIVELGAQVLVEVEEQKDDFKIVGTLEANPVLGWISNESPVGRALLGHKVGDEVMVSSPIKTIYKVKKIRYLES